MKLFEVDFDFTFYFLWLNCLFILKLHNIFVWKGHHSLQRVTLMRNKISQTCRLFAIQSWYSNIRCVNITYATNQLINLYWINKWNISILDHLMLLYSIGFLLVFMCWLDCSSIRPTTSSFKKHYLCVIFYQT